MTESLGTACQQPKGRSMRIDSILRSKQSFSFEIFPPRGDLSVEQARGIANEMEKCRPDWISVTFSAGGSGNSQNTVEIARDIQEAGKTTALAHLTCLGSTKADVDSIVDRLESHGVENILALRGDRAPGREASDFHHASDLIAYLRQRGLCVGGACYPEGHVACESLKTDLENLKLKQDAGVDFLVTQLFFRNEDFYRFREKCTRARIKVPIICGIMPFTSVNQIQRMAFNCGASIPAAVVKRLVRAGDSPEAQRVAGVEYACEQLEDLARNGVDGIHVYSMNKPEIARAAHECLVAAGYLEA